MNILHIFSSGKSLELRSTNVISHNYNHFHMQIDREIRYLMFYAQSTAKGETKCIPTTSNIVIHYFKHTPPLKMRRHFDKMKLNEPGRQKL